MQSEIHLEAIDTHTAGMPTRILLSGQDYSKQVEGSVAAQRDAFAEDQDHLRELLIREPRGHKDMFGAVPTRPQMDEADLGLFFMDHDGYLDMCGHGTIGVVTAFIETNQLQPTSTITIETPAGLVEAYPEVSDGRVESVGLQNVNSYRVESRTITAPFEYGGDGLDVDIMYAGNYFAMVDGAQLDLELDTTNTNAFIDHGLAVRRLLNEEHEITDPLTGDPVSISLTEFYDGSGPVDRNIVVFADGAVDRSPCGTGTCAKMSLLYEKDQLAPNETYPHESIIGTRFEGTIRDVETRDGTDVTTPVVWGSAHIVSDTTFVLDESDPTPSFTLFDN